MKQVRYYDSGAVQHGVLTEERTVRAQAAPAGTPQLDGIITGLFTDHHVHLQLVDHTLLPASRLGHVVDLGGNPAVLRSLFLDQVVRNSGKTDQEAGAEGAECLNRQMSPELRTPAVEYAGPFLTSTGGYPSDRDWAPEGSVRQITDAADAASAVAELASAGVSFIKIVMNSDAGPVLDDAAFRAIVTAADAHGLPVVAHAEGAGQAQRAVHLGASRLAHSPFSERLSDDEIAVQAASVQWISTLAIHEGTQRAIAIDNVRRFAAAGGTVLYGSDMGNGDTPVDLRPSEIDALREAGVVDIALLRALAPLSPLADDAALLFLPAGDPALARPLTPADLEA